MNRKMVVGLGLALAISASPQCWAQSTATSPPGAEESIESRFQLDFHVADAALKKLVPAGWNIQVAAQGPAKDCNVRVIFIDRVNITGADGKPVGAGANQIVYLTVPVKQISTGNTGQMVIAGLTANATDVPGPFGVYIPAIQHQMTRVTSAAKEAGIVEEQTWDFSAASGEHIQMHAKYERVPAPRALRETKYFSPVNAGTYQMAKSDSGLNIARNATVEMPDRVKEFNYKISGGRLGALFDGTEKVLSVDIFPWNNLSISQQSN